MDLVRQDMYLAPHLRWYMREVRLVAYSQFLESYKSVTLDSMAAAFDVSPDFLDQVGAGQVRVGWRGWVGRERALGGLGASSWCGRCAVWGCARG